MLNENLDITVHDKNMPQSKIVSVPAELLIQEKASQRDRCVLGVMQALFNRLPAKKTQVTETPDFVLEDGTRCWIMGFSPPKWREEAGEYMYGFDIRMKGHRHLDHLEFFVRCSGFGGA